MYVSNVYPSCCCPGITAGVPQVLRLMLAALTHSELADDTETPCIMASLCSLPAAQALQAAAIAAVLHRGISIGCWHRLHPLLQLPNATAISTQCLCGLIKAAAGASAFKLVSSLCSYEPYKVHLLCMPSQVCSACGMLGWVSACIPFQGPVMDRRCNVALRWSCMCRALGHLR